MVHVRVRVTLSLAGLAGLGFVLDFFLRAGGERQLLLCFTLVRMRGARLENTLASPSGSCIEPSGSSRWPLPSWHQQPSTKSKKKENLENSRQFSPIHTSAALMKKMRKIIDDCARTNEASSSDMRAHK